MYRYSNGQISLADFKQPVGMDLKESNRWVKKAQTIPWPEIEKRCAALFTNRKGNVAKPLRLALGACIIQAEYGYSDEETAGPLCEEKRESRWSLARSWTSVSLTDGRGWSAVLLAPTMRRKMAERFRAREGHYPSRILAQNKNWALVQWTLYILRR